MRAVAWCSVGSLLCISCGGAAPKPQPAPVTVAANAVRAEPEPDDTPDLSPVAAPSELFLVGRFKAPRPAIDTVADWAHLPFRLQDALTGDLRPLQSIVAWDAPVEVAAALDEEGQGKFPEPLIAFSFGATSVDSVLSFARAQGWPVQKTAPGVYQLGEEDIACAVSRAVGVAPARVVCGHRTRDIDGLLGYMTRGLPSQALSPVDFTLEFRAAPLKHKYSGEIASLRMLTGFALRELQKDSPRFDRALSDCMYAAVDEAVNFVADFDSIALNANVDRASGELVFGMDEQLGGARSWLVQGSLEMAQSKPPDAFWQLPADSSVATWSTGWKPGRLKPLGRSLGELLAGYLEAEKVPPKVRDAWSKLLQASFDDTLAMVSAKGELSDVPNERGLAAMYRLFGWELVGTPGEAKHYQALIEDLSAALANKDFQKLLKQRLKVEANVLPTLRARDVSLKGFKPGAREYDIELPRTISDALLAWRSGVISAASDKSKAKAKPKKEPGFSLTVMIARDDDRTWIGYSPDAKAVRARLESLHDPATPRLATRADLAQLKSSPGPTGGFMALKSLASALRAAVGESAATGMINALPHHGETPILLMSSVQPGAPNRMGMQMRFPKAAVEDVGALIPAVALLGDRRHWDFTGPVGIVKP